MSNIDEKIREALNEEDQKVLDQFGDEPGPIAMALATFQGKQGWFAAGVWVLGFVAFALLVFCALNYFATEDIKSSMTWGLGMVFCGLSLVIAKIGAWQQMQTQALLREIKRLELRWLTAME